MSAVNRGISNGYDYTLHLAEYEQKMEQTLFRLQSMGMSEHLMSWVVEILRGWGIVDSGKDFKGLLEQMGCSSWEWACGNGIPTSVPAGPLGKEQFALQVLLSFLTVSQAVRIFCGPRGLQLLAALSGTADPYEEVFLWVPQIVQDGTYSCMHLVECGLAAVPDSFEAFYSESVQIDLEALERLCLESPPEPQKERSNILDTR